MVTKRLHQIRRHSEKLDRQGRPSFVHHVEAEFVPFQTPQQLADCLQELEEISQSDPAQALELLKFRRQRLNQHLEFFTDESNIAAINRQIEAFNKLEEKISKLETR